MELVHSRIGREMTLKEGEMTFEAFLDYDETISMSKSARILTRNVLKT